MQGTSVDLNAGNLPAMHSWTDLARDLRNFLTHCMPEDGEEVGWALEWRAERPTRPVVGVGHSVGGNANVQAANASPELFESLFLIEPMVGPLRWDVADADKPDGLQQFSSHRLPRTGLNAEAAHTLALTCTGGGRDAPEPDVLPVPKLRL